MQLLGIRIQLRKIQARLPKRLRRYLQKQRKLWPKPLLRLKVQLRQRLQRIRMLPKKQ